MSNALLGLADGSRTHLRKQEVMTPQSIVDFVRLVFGGDIAMDPCAAQDPDTLNPRGLVQADYVCFENDDRDGLTVSWPDRTYCNPPYKHLKPWLAKALEEQARGSLPRIVVLCPVRSHRSWWRQARDVARHDGFVLELNPLAFLGYGQTFPAPLALFGFNCEPLSRETYAAGDKLGGFL